MTIENAFQGSLFSNGFLLDSITRLPDWQSVADEDLGAIREALRAVFDRFPLAQTPNESQTEDDLIWPVLEALGWTASLRQQNLAVRGRDDVPDGLLFADDAAKARANEFPEEWRRYGLGLALVESKRWLRPLDRRSGRRGEEIAPSTQMLRYLRRVDDLTAGGLRWGFLTNGARWRLYWQGARSVSEQFFEVDLAAILDLPGHNEGLFALDEAARRHWLRVFVLAFRCDAFLPGTDGRSFHQRALDEGRFYEERVSDSLSGLVFGEVFPALVRAIAGAEPEAPLQDVREAALILLYRLLFILYAEDRDLLPVRDTRYDDYGLRDRVRLDIGRRLNENDTFSDTAARYWSSVEDLCRAISAGDASIGLPPYNGGLFEAERTPLLTRVRIPDSVMAEVIDRLSFERAPTGRKYINYRDLSVQQLGSIYERLLEHEVVREGDGTVAIRPNAFARRGSGSYYTPEDLVVTILNETVEPLVEARLEAFRERASHLSASDQSEARRLGQLRLMDPAERLLELKICDPAMGSGHFLVSLVDMLADRVIAAMAEAEVAVDWAEYVSPLSDRIDAIRNTILGNAEERGWAIDEEQLDDRHIIRRMVLKRCVYGVDKNQMAVELAKVALWLHTFTVGAPLSFLDHHLRCGDSLFGLTVRAGADKAGALGSPLLLHAPMRRAMGAAASMRTIENLTDAEIAEAHHSAEIFDGVREMTAPLDAFLSLIHAFDWLDLKGADDRQALRAFFDGQFGDPVDIAMGRVAPDASRSEGRRFADILWRAQALVAEENFLNWQVAFPGVWRNWESNEPEGGFDAVIGNPPWDRMKLQQVEWFAARRREIAMATRAADRRRMIDALEAEGDPLADDFARASERAEAAARVARASGAYPLLSGGDTNLYSLFVERAMALIRPTGMAGLLTPSGIASDKTAAPFFKSVATEGRLKALYDFENRKVFFPDVHASFKFCIFVASRTPTKAPAKCAFYLHGIDELADPERCFPLTAEDFARVNPKTGTAPIFRTRRDADLTTAIYARLPLLDYRPEDWISPAEWVTTWPVKYMTMFHMTNDSGRFRTRRELEEEDGAYPVGGNRFAGPEGEWLPLYEGKMVQAFDHRAASVVVNPENQHRPAQAVPATAEQHRDPDWLPDPQFWVPARDVPWPEAKHHFGTTRVEWAIGFKDVTASTNMRTMIAAVVPAGGAGNTLPLIAPDYPPPPLPEHQWGMLEEYAMKCDEVAFSYIGAAPLLLANYNATIFDFVARQKVQGQHLNWYILEQLPVFPPESFTIRELRGDPGVRLPETYDTVRFGPRSAAEIVREAVLELTYTSHDMAPFARDLAKFSRETAYMNGDDSVPDGDQPVPPPFNWDEERRLHLRAKLDAVYFHLYGVTDREDVRHVYSTFPIVERQEEERWGRYLSRDLCLAWMSALAAGDPDADIRL